MHIIMQFEAMPSILNLALNYYIFFNRNQYYYSFQVFPAYKKRINLVKMTMRKKKKRIKTKKKIETVKNPR